MSLSSDANHSSFRSLRTRLIAPTASSLRISLRVCRSAHASAAVLRVVTGSARTHAQTDIDGFRLRPGERPTWIELELAEDEVVEWRRRAAARGLSIDVWLTLQVEWTLVVGDIGAETAGASKLDGIELYLDERLREPDELELDVGGLRRKQVHAYWDGCLRRLTGRPRRAKRVHL